MIMIYSSYVLLCSLHGVYCIGPNVIIIELLMTHSLAYTCDVPPKNNTLDDF